MSLLGDPNQPYQEDPQVEMVNQLKDIREYLRRLSEDVQRIRDDVDKLRQKIS